MDDLTHNVQLCLDSARIHESKIKFTEKNLGFIVKSLIASNTFKELKTVLAIKNQDSPCVIFMEPGGLKVGKINVRRFMYKTFRDPELESKINQWNITCGDVSCINPYHVVFKSPTHSGRTPTPSVGTPSPVGRTLTPYSRTLTPSGGTSAPSGRTPTPSDRTPAPSGRTLTPGGTPIPSVRTPTPSLFSTTPTSSYSSVRTPSQVSGSLYPSLSISPSSTTPSSMDLESTIQQPSSSLGKKTGYKNVPIATTTKQKETWSLQRNKPVINLKWGSEEFKYMSNMESMKGHDEMLANTLDQLLAVAPGAYHNIIVHCSDGTINTNKFLIYSCFPVLSSVNQDVDYTIYLPDYCRRELSSLIQRFLDDMRGGKSRQSDKKANEYYIPVTDTDQGGLLGFISTYKNDELSEDTPDQSNTDNITQNKESSNNTKSERSVFPASCLKCKLVFKSLSKFSHHKCFYSGAENRCKICFKQFAISNNLTKHLQKGYCREVLDKMHKDDMKVVKKKKISLRCKGCLERFFCNVRYYHHQCVNDGNPDVCRFCQKKFLGRNLISHFTGKSPCNAALKSFHTTYINTKETVPSCPISVEPIKENSDTFPNIKLKKFSVDIEKCQEITRKQTGKRSKNQESEEQSLKKQRHDNTGKLKIEVTKNQDAYLVQKQCKVEQDDIVIEIDNGEEDVADDEVQILDDEMVGTDKDISALEVEYPVPEPRKTSSQFSRSQESPELYNEESVSNMCLDCHGYFTAQEFYSHQTNCKGKYYCEPCDVQFSGSFKLKKHNDKHHNHLQHKETKPVVASELMFGKLPCPYCDYEAPNGLLDCHYQISTECRKLSEQGVYRQTITPYSGVDYSSKQTQIKQEPEAPQSINQYSAIRVKQEKELLELVAKELGSPSSNMRNQETRTVEDGDTGSNDVLDGMTLSETSDDDRVETTLDKSKDRDTGSTNTSIDSDEIKVSLGCIPGTPRWFDLLQVPSKYGSKKNIEKFFWEHQIKLLSVGLLSRDPIKMIQDTRIKVSEKDGLKIESMGIKPPGSIIIPSDDNRKPINPLHLQTSRNH